MFHTSILKATAAARPVRMSGVAEISVSLRPRDEPRAVSTIFTYTSPGSLPVTARKTAPTMRAASTDATGTTTVSVRDARPRGST